MREKAREIYASSAAAYITDGQVFCTTKKTSNKKQLYFSLGN